MGRPCELLRTLSYAHLACTLSRASGSTRVSLRSGLPAYVASCEMVRARPSMGASASLFVHAYIHTRFPIARHHTYAPHRQPSCAFIFPAPTRVLQYVCSSTECQLVEIRTLVSALACYSEKACSRRSTPAYYRSPLAVMAQTCAVLIVTDQRTTAFQLLLCTSVPSSGWQRLASHPAHAAIRCALRLWPLGKCRHTSRSSPHHRGSLRNTPVLPRAFFG